MYIDSLIYIAEYSKALNIAASYIKENDIMSYFLYWQKAMEIGKHLDLDDKDIKYRNLLKKSADLLEKSGLIEPIRTSDLHMNTGDSLTKLNDHLPKTPDEISKLYTPSQEGKFNIMHTQYMLYRTKIFFIWKELLKAKYKVPTYVTNQIVRSENKIYIDMFSLLTLGKIGISKRYLASFSNLVVSGYHYAQLIQDYVELNLNRDGMLYINKGEKIPISTKIESSDILDMINEIDSIKNL